MSVDLSHRFRKALIGLMLSDANAFLRKITPFAPAIEIAAGIMLIGVGVLLLSGQLISLNRFFDFARFNEGL